MRDVAFRLVALEACTTLVLGQSPVEPMGGGLHHRVAGKMGTDLTLRTVCVDWCVQCTCMRACLRVSMRPGGD